jgi:hypothetical protein
MMKLSYRCDNPRCNHLWDTEGVIPLECPDCHNYNLSRVMYEVAGPQDSNDSKGKKAKRVPRVSDSEVSRRMLVVFSISRPKDVQQLEGRPNNPPPQSQS